MSIKVSLFAASHRRAVLHVVMKLQQHNKQTAKLIKSQNFCFCAANYLDRNYKAFHRASL
jgi:hypothetical protein